MTFSRHFSVLRRRSRNCEVGRHAHHGCVPTLISTFYSITERIVNVMKIELNFQYIQINMILQRSYTFIISIRRQIINLTNTIKLGATSNPNIINLSLFLPCFHTLTARPINMKFHILVRTVIHKESTLLPKIRKMIFSITRTKSRK